MNKYIYAECPIDIWPEIKTIIAGSYNDAIERLAKRYSVEFDDVKTGLYIIKHLIQPLLIGFIVKE